MSTPLLALDQLSLTYPGMPLQSLDNISLSLQKGEILSLIGESGSGKSSLLRVIAGFERPQAGSVTLAGDTLTTPNRFTPPEQRGIGFVSQQGDLFPHLTIAQNICYGLKGVPKAERKEIAETLLSQIQLPGYNNKYPNELSGGEKQRVALARALALSPRLLLLDEPFSSLDTRLRKELLQLTFDLLRQRQTTAIFVTHHSTDALRVGDRVGVMHGGKLMQIGTPQDVWTTPASMQVGRLFYEVNDYSGIPSNIRCAHNMDCWGKVRDLKISTDLSASSYALSATVLKQEFLGDEVLLTLQLAHASGLVKAYYPAANVPTIQPTQQLKIMY